MEKTKLEERKKVEEEDLDKLMKLREQNDLEVSELKQELEITKKMYELRCLQMETEAEGAKTELEERSKELEQRLEDSKNKVKQLESYSESKHESWNQKEHICQSLMEFQLGALRVCF